MRKIICILFILVSIVSCKQIEQKIHDLIPVDSLGWQDHENYMISKPSCITAMEKRLLVADESNTIKVYDPSTMEYITEFGKSGKAPLEFQGIQGISEYKNGFVVADVFNMRLQFLNEDFSYKSSIITQSPYNTSLSQDKSRLYYNTHIGYPDNSIFYIENDSTKLFYKMHEWLDKHNLQKPAERYYDFLSFGRSILITFQSANTFLIVNESGINKQGELEIPQSEYDDYTSFLCPKLYKDGFLLIIVFSQKNADEETKTESKLVLYNFEGKIMQVYNLKKDDAYYPWTWGLAGDDAFLYSRENGVIHKYHLH